MFTEWLVWGNMRREYPAGGSRNKKGKKRSESMISGQDDHPVIRNKLEDDTFSPKRRSQRVECSWTNFHCALFLGVGGFLLFWIFLLLRLNRVLILFYCVPLYCVVFYSGAGIGGQIVFVA